MSDSIVLNEAEFRWETGDGRLDFFGISSVLFWLDPSLLNILQPLRDEAGPDLYRALVAHQGSLGAEVDYRSMVTMLGPSFEDGFDKWGRAVSTAGWGTFRLAEFSRDRREAVVAVQNPWELRMLDQREGSSALKKIWGCPFLMGKLVGIFSNVLGENCYAEEDVDETSVRFRIFSSEETFLSDVKRIRLDRLMGQFAHTWAQLFRYEADRGNRSVTERRRPYSDLFRKLDEARLSGVQKVEIRWGDDFLRRILDSEAEALERTLKSVLMTLVGEGVVDLGTEVSPRNVKAEDVDYYLDLSQLGRVLNLSLGQPRDRIPLDSFLERMTTTGGLVQAHTDQPLAGVRVFLIHHLTVEILGLIAALRQLGCRDLVTLFVSYSGDPPSTYLDPLLELPTDEFRCLSLTNISEGASVEGRYRLATQYSFLEDYHELSAALARTEPRFLLAMEAVAKIEFLRQFRRNPSSGERCLIIEDGGYLAPAISRACLERRTVGDFLGDPRHPDARLDLRDYLEGRLIGSSEHTRNGYNRLLDVQSEHGELAFPAFSIAVSHLKREGEGKEVAVSILNAVENVLHGAGMILSRRHCLVLGSRGAIGKRLIQLLAQRLDDTQGQLAGVDLEAPATGGSFPECPCYRDLPAEVRKRIDLVLGVIGTSVLKGDDLEEWLLEGEQREIYFASGSTKTEEFREISEWMGRLMRDPRPRLGDRPVGIQAGEVRDPLSSRLYARRFQFSIETATGNRRKDVIFLAKLMPVNFMFYGVPTENIDMVLAQLLRVSLGLVRRSRGEPVPPRLHAVDHEINDDGTPL